MKQIAFFVALLVICVLLSGCVYSSCNVIRAQGKSIMLLGGEGLIYLKDASVDFVRTMDSKSHNPGGDYASRPNFIEKADSSNMSFGSAKSIGQPPQDTSSDNSAIVNAAAAVITK